jgi:hypothetical protein
MANTFACTFSRAQKGTYARRKSKIVKGQYKTLKQKKNGSAKPPATEDIFDLPISDCELQEAIKQLKNNKISWGGPNARRICKACR